MDNKNHLVLDEFLSDLKGKVDTTCVAALVDADNDNSEILGEPLEIIDIDSLSATLSSDLEKHSGRVSLPLDSVEVFYSIDVIKRAFKNSIEPFLDDYMVEALEDDDYDF